jgi:hypothetical protein
MTRGSYQAFRCRAATIDEIAIFVDVPVRAAPAGRHSMAVHLPIAVGRAFLDLLRKTAIASADGFCEVWVIADDEAIRLRP